MICGSSHIFNYWTNIKLQLRCAFKNSINISSKIKRFICMPTIVCQWTPLCLTLIWKSRCNSSKLKVFYLQPHTSRTVYPRWREIASRWSTHFILLHVGKLTCLLIEPLLSKPWIGHYHCAFPISLEALQSVLLSVNKGRLAKLATVWTFSTIWNGNFLYASSILKRSNIVCTPH